MISSAGVSAGVDVFLPPRSTRVEGLCGAPGRLVWSTFANRGTAEKRMRRWCRLQRLVESDPILRLHCAMQSPLAGLTDARTGRTVIVQSANPYPAHPRHPGETVPVTLDALVRPRPAEGGSLLDLAIDNRADRGMSELEFLLAYVVRPLLRTVCAGLDRHHVALLRRDGDGLAFELSPEMSMTGRVVIGDVGGPEEGSDLTPAEAGETMRALRTCLDALVTGFRHGDVRHAVNRAAAEELRFQCPSTARVLRQAYGTRRWGRTVTADQDRILRGVLHRVSKHAQRRRDDRRVPKPAVAIGLDVVAPGLTRFVHDVMANGGEVVFHRVRALADVEVVAIFDDLADNRRTLAQAFPHATLVAVELPGLATGCGVTDGMPVIASFETLPPANGAPDPSLSNVQSLGRVPVGELRIHAVARDHAVHLSAEQSVALTEQLVARADATARRTARTARERLRADAGQGCQVDRATMLIHYLLTRKRYHKGSRANYPPEAAGRDMRAFLQSERPVQVVLQGFPVKQAHSGLKAHGFLPDLAELAAIVRLRELQQAVRALYEPGLRITVITDGRHFRPRHAELTGAYQRKLREYLRLVGDDAIEFHDIDELAAARLGVGTRERHDARIAEHQGSLRRALHGLDVGRNPLAVLDRASERAPAAPESATFKDLFMSLVHSVPVLLPPGKDRMAWSREVYADVYDVVCAHAAERVVEARRNTLRTTWSQTIRYVAARQADWELGYEGLFSSRVRLANVPRKGCCGFTYLGGSCLLPWHGTSAVDVRGLVSTDFAVCLSDQGFVPVYSELLGNGQPWFMVPVTATRARGRRRGTDLDGDYLRSIRLRER